VKSIWSSFFNQHKSVLEQNYPGITLQRFLLEISDLIKTDHQNLEELLLKGIPFPYLLNNSEFYYNHFFVNENVLIPRPETEYLADLIIQEHKGKVKNVLDIGTGSGVILLSLLAHGVGESGVGVDISEAALTVAQENTKRLGLAEKVKLIQSDRLNNVEGTFDLIVSNPPYIKESSHKSLVHQSVHSYEPHLALYLPDSEYEKWFEEFFLDVKKHLKGVFYMEGHELEVESQARQLEKLGFQKVKVLKDLTGTVRFLKAECCNV
jgi:release factor glutamine methyltransferase